MGKHPESVDSRVRSKIRRHGRGWVFTPAAFDELHSNVGVRLALMRAVRSGWIRQLVHGLYYFPRVHPTLGELQPSVDAVARAMAGRTATLIQPSGAYAANLLGLSEQVPQKLVYLTDGTSKRFRFGNSEIILRKTSPKNMATAGRISGLVIQALRHLGKDNVDSRTKSILKDRLNPEDKKKLLKDISYAPRWVGDIMREVAAT